MAWLDLGKCLEKPPPGCSWVTAPPPTPGPFKEARVLFGQKMWYLDCDCRATGKCQAGEPPPVPVFEFLQRDKGSLYLDIEVAGPTEFMEAKSGPYDYHWGSWHNPYSEGPGPLVEPSAQGPAHTVGKRDDNHPPISTVREASTPVHLLVSEHFVKMLEESGWDPFDRGQETGDDDTGQRKKSDDDATQSTRRHPRDWDVGCDR